MITIQERGTERAFVGVNQAQITGESFCCENGEVCQDSITITDGDTVTGFTLQRTDGSTQFVEIMPTSTNVGIASKIIEALIPFETNISVWFNGTTLIHQGQSRILSVNVNGTDVATTLTCNTAIVCDYCVTVSDTPGSVVYDVNTAALAGAPYTVDATLLADMTAALTAALVPFIPASVTVTANLIAAGFDVKFKAVHGLTVKVGTREFEANNCTEVFV